MINLMLDMEKKINEQHARIAELEKALQEIMDADVDMGMYPAAIRGYNDERDYEQRDGFKNGWNAACTEFVNKATAIVFRVHPDVSIDGSR